MMKTPLSSALARDGCIYGLDDGLPACIEATTGKRQLNDGRYGIGQKLLVGDVEMVRSQRGPIVLVEANHEAFKALAHLPAFNRKTWTYPTLADRYLLVRNDLEVVCYELPVASASTAAAMRWVGQEPPDN